MAMTDFQAPQPAPCGLDLNVPASFPGAVRSLAHSLAQLAEKCRPGYCVSKGVRDQIDECHAVASAAVFAIENQPAAIPAPEGAQPDCEPSDKVRIAMLEALVADRDKSLRKLREPVPGSIWLYDFMDGVGTVRDWSTTDTKVAFQAGHFNQRRYVPEHAAQAPAEGDAALDHALHLLRCVKSSAELSIPAAEGWRFLEQAIRGLAASHVQPKGTAAVPEGEPWDEHQLDGIFDAVRCGCGPATASRVRALLRVFQAGEAPDGAHEALQRLIENAAAMGPASRDDARVVMKWRRTLLSPRPVPSPAVQDGWQPIATAPDDTLVVVAWWESDETRHHDFDWLEDGCWHQWHDHAEHVEVIGGHGVSYTAPYTHWLPLPAIPYSSVPVQPQ